MLLAPENLRGLQPATLRFRAGLKLATSWVGLECPYNYFIRTSCVNSSLVLQSRSNAVLGKPTAC
jgi:hypothetical protein